MCEGVAWFTLSFLPAVLPRIVFRIIQVVILQRGDDILVSKTSGKYWFLLFPHLKLAILLSCNSFSL